VREQILAEVRARAAVDKVKGKPKKSKEQAS
jgi:ribosomal protein S21